MHELNLWYKQKTVSALWATAQNELPIRITRQIFSEFKYILRYEPGAQIG
jgi:hypothetical protein